jgi:hypothetical protein
MIAAAPIVDRLEARGCKKVEGLIEFAGLKNAPAISPAYFVIPARDAAPRDSDQTGIHDQRVQAQFRVVIVVKPAVRVEGGISRQLEEEERRVIDALIGWTHPDAAGPVNYAGGSLLSADGWGVAWAVDFRTAWRLRKGTS